MTVPAGRRPVSPVLMSASKRETVGEEMGSQGSARSPHYHVIENTPGYLPEDMDSFAYTSLRDAEQTAKEQADSYREYGEEIPGRYTKTGRWVRPRWQAQYRISGNATDGYTVTDTSKTHDLGRVIQIVECDEPECLEEEV